MKFIYAFVFLIIALTGCSSSGVIPTDRGAYMISKKSAAGIFGTPDGVRGDIYIEANEFCARSGKTVETLKTEIKGAIPFMRTGSAMLEFKCVSQ